MVKGTPNHHHHLKILVQKRIQEHPKAENLSDKRRLIPINDRCPKPLKSSGLSTHIASVFSGLSFNQFTHIQSLATARKGLRCLGLVRKEGEKMLMASAY